MSGAGHTRWRGLLISVRGGKSFSGEVWVHNIWMSARVGAQKICEGSEGPEGEGFAGVIFEGQMRYFRDCMCIQIFIAQIWSVQGILNSKFEIGSGRAEEEPESHHGSIGDLEFYFVTRVTSVSRAEFVSEPHMGC